MHRTISSWLRIIAVGLIPWIPVAPLFLFYPEFLRGFEGKSAIEHAKILEYTAMFALPPVVYLYERLCLYLVSFIPGDDPDRPYEIDFARLFRSILQQNWVTRFDRLGAVLKAVQDAIDKEFGDVASRVTWGFAGQSLLLSAFVTVLGNGRLSENVQHWLAFGIAMFGTTVSLSLLVGTMLGHAHILQRKRERDALERLRYDWFGIEPNGIALRSPIGNLKHSASRYLPCCFYIAWILITMATVTRTFDAPRHPEGLFVPPWQSRWEISDLSPVFRRGKWEYLKEPLKKPGGGTPAKDPSAEKGSSVTECPKAPEEASETEAARWAAGIAERWATRANRRSDDVIVLVGGADRTPRSENQRQSINSNLPLARARAETVLNLLVEASKDRPEESERISREKALILVAAQSWKRIEPESQDADRDCDANDRRVRVWFGSTR